MKTVPKAACAAAMFATLLTPLSSALAAGSNTIYGVIDTDIDISNQGAGTVKKLQTGGAYGSRVGFTGSQDLGDALTSVYTLELGFASDTGTLQQGGRVFGRQAFVGLANEFGSLTVGRQYSPQFYTMASTDAFLYGNAAGLTVLTRTVNGVPGFILGAFNNTSRQDNSIVYTSPVTGGVVARLLYAFGEGTGSRALDAGVQYTAHGFDIGAGITDVGDVDGYGAYKVWTLGGSYKWDPVQVFVGLTRDINTTADVAAHVAPATVFKLMNVGMKYQVTPKTVLIAQAIRVDDMSPAAAGQKNGTALGVGFSHSFNKTTAVYGSVGTIGNHNGSAYSLGGGLYAGSAVVGDARAKTVQLGINLFF